MLAPSVRCFWPGYAERNAFLLSMGTDSLLGPGRQQGQRKLPY